MTLICKSDDDDDENSAIIVNQNENCDENWQLQLKLKL